MELRTVRDFYLPETAHFAGALDERPPGRFGGSFDTENRALSALRQGDVILNGSPARARFEFPSEYWFEASDHREIKVRDISILAGPETDGYGSEHDTLKTGA